MKRLAIQCIALLLAACLSGRFCLQNAISGHGFTLRVSLSDYRNPHQVLADTGVACDQGAGAKCDPVFEVQLGMQSYSYPWFNKSGVFTNAYNLTGEFYRTHFQIDQELPDSIFLMITVYDNDPWAHEQSVIAKPELELPRLLPSTPSRSNAVRQLLEYTRTNRYVSFAVEVEVTCNPGHYGRRCSQACPDGQTGALPAWDTSDSLGSLEVVCSAKKNASGSSQIRTGVAEEAQSQVFGLRQNHLIIGIVGVASLIAIIAMIVGFSVNSRRKRRERRRQMVTIYQIPAGALEVSLQPSVQTVQVAAGTRVESFRNPVYNPAENSLQTLESRQQQQQQQQLTQRPPGQSRPVRGQALPAARQESNLEEVYEEMDDPNAPPVPPRISCAVAAP